MASELPGDLHELQLRPITPDGVEHSLEKASRYRMLNQPGEAESICRDVLEVAPDDQRALTDLLLALTDQFPRGLAERLDESWQVVARITDEFERTYYSGIICERRAKHHHRQSTPGCGDMAYHCFAEAMQWFEQADALSPADDDDAVLRWNSCVRYMRAHPEIRPVAETEPPMMTE